MRRAALIIVLAALAFCACARGEGTSGYVVPTKGYEPVETADIVYTPENAPAVTAQIHNGVTYLFLPSGADPQELVIDGQAIPCRLTPGINTVTDNAGKARSFMVMQSANLRAVYLVSDDPENAGRAYIDGSADHSTVASAQSTITDAQGEPEYRGKVEKLRGRGNTTWEWGAKKPYQIKLEQKADLLNTGARNNTYLLLADCFDATLLHNTLALTVARQIGLPAPACEPVDLYYDGVYRGTYLLCEKPEVRQGMLDIPDYDKAIGKQYDTDGLPTAQAENRYGCPYQYLDGLNVYGGKDAAFLVEIDQYFYQTERAWVSTASGLHFTVQNPGSLSKEDGAYIGELLQRAENAVEHGGIDPDTGEKVSDLLDYESLAKFFLLSEWSKNPDYWRGSTFLYKPAGEDKLYAGPVWDFDIAFAVREQESGATGYLRDGESWLRDLCALPDFQETVRSVWESDVKPALQTLSLTPFTDRVAKSASMNFVLWPFAGEYNNINRDTVYPTWKGNLTYLQTYLSDRLQWLDQDLSGWMGYTITNASLTLSYRNADVSKNAVLSVANSRNNVTASDIHWQSEPDPDVAWHNLYTVNATLTAADGCALADGFSSTVNGCAVTTERRDERTAAIRFTFSGPQYEPALYDGDDYGMLYQYDYFVAHNPDAVEACGTEDPDALLEYFVTSGLYDELCGIETYVSQEFILNYEKKMNAYFMDDPSSCAEYYREHCVDEDLLGMAQPAFPAVKP